jgi:hypothetical protein
MAEVVIGGALLGTTLYQGEQGRRAQKKSLQMQQQAQSDATARAIKQEQDNERAFARANQRQPDIAAMLASGAMPRRGLATLSGPMGIDEQLLDIGTPKLLGE